MGSPRVKLRAGCTSILGQALMCVPAPGGHYFATGFADPWFTTWSKTSGSTSASGNFIVGASGYDTLAENYLHAVVLLAASGSRIGCVHLGSYSTVLSELAAAMGPCPGTSSGISRTCLTLVARTWNAKQLWTCYVQ
ncbi:unnamed protein product [Prorocentrum cordatum]|uniref:Uncharacterized protein n=1 Tax=Prorocentrum cordatum TaxID=2364126 RepID=A0ABN9VPI5_9DINO|nr:unnamed protein product [Polarella glacialis]